MKALNLLTEEDINKIVYYVDYSNNRVVEDTIYNILSWLEYDIDTLTYREIKDNENIIVDLSDLDFNNCGEICLTKEYALERAKEILTDFDDEIVEGV